MISLILPIRFGFFWFWSLLFKPGDCKLEGRYGFCQGYIAELEEDELEEDELEEDELVFPYPGSWRLAI
jgi:hypothetical protein